MVMFEHFDYVRKDVAGHLSDEKSEYQVLIEMCGQDRDLLRASCPELRRVEKSDGFRK